MGFSVGVGVNYWGNFCRGGGGGSVGILMGVYNGWGLVVGVCIGVWGFVLGFCVGVLCWGWVNKMGMLLGVLFGGG